MQTKGSLRMIVAVVAGGLALGIATTVLAQQQRGASRESVGREGRVAEAGSDSAIPPEFRVTVTPEMRRHTRIRNILYFVGTAWGLGALAITFLTGISRRLREVAERIRWRLPAAIPYYAMLLVVLSLISFPLTVYSGYVVPHQFDLSDQSFAAWLGDQLKGLGIGIAFGAPMAALALWGIRRMPRRWWLALWAGGVPIAVFMTVVAPIVIDPVFNDFVHLKNPVLERKILDLASRAGIHGSRVWEVDKSRQTKTMNAYVTGLGPTKRIVIWDTLLAKMTDDEILVVMGHEMGHYVLNHVWKGLAFGSVLMFGVLFVVYRIVEWGIARWGPGWGFTTAADPAAIPWLLFVLYLGMFLLSPVISGFSRYVEHQSDVFTLELTHGNEAAARAFIKFAEDSKVDPYPSPFIEFWRSSHPPLGKRIAFALSYRPWENGRPNQLWHPSRDGG